MRIRLIIQRSFVVRKPPLNTKSFSSIRSCVRYIGAWRNWWSFCLSSNTYFIATCKMSLLLYRNDSTFILRFNFELQIFCFVSILIYHHVHVLSYCRMDESAISSSGEITFFLQLDDRHDNISSLVEDFIPSNSTGLAGFYQSFPYCVLPNVSVGNISEPEKSYFPLFEFVISLVLLVVVALPGLVGNFISIFILSRPQMRTSLNVILIGTLFLVLIAHSYLITTQKIIWEIII